MRRLALALLLLISSCGDESRPTSPPQPPAERPAETLEASRDALRAARTAGEPETLTISLANLGVALIARAQHDKALPLLREARDLAIEHELAAHLRRIRSNLATLHRDQGRYAEAIALLEELVRDTAAPTDPRTTAHVRMQLASCYLLIQQPDRARPHLDHALELAEGVSDAALCADIHVNRAAASREMGQLDEAQEALAKAARLRRDRGDESHALRIEVSAAGLLLDKGHPQQALARLRMLAPRLSEAGDAAGALRARLRAAGVLLRLRQHQKADALLVELMPAATELGDAGLLGLLYARLAATRHRRKAYADVRKFAGAALAATEAYSGRLAEEDLALLRGGMRSVCTLGADACQRLLDPAGAFEFHERARAGAFREGLQARDAIRRAVIPAGLRSAEDAARAAVDAAERALGQARATGERTKIRAALGARNAARDAVIAVVRTIRSSAKVGASLVFPSSTSLAELRTHLADDQALVLLASYTGASQAVVITRVGFDVFPLGPYNEIREAVGELRLHDRDADPAEPLERLRKLISARIWIPESAKRLLISPEGSLCYVPLGLLFPEHEVTYVPSGTAYTLLRSQVTEARGTKVLAVADPAYRGGLPRRLPRLPETRVEAQAVADTVLAGDQATIARLRDALQTQHHWRSVHFACHGILDAQRPMLSGLALTPTGPLTADLLTTLEVLRLPINADLVVLSACSTGRGKVYVGEGVVGLSRAFMFAGAPRVIASLWKVDDAATRALMLEFYRLWRGPDGLPAAAALRKAQAHVRGQGKWRHPYYWSAWVLWGLAD